MKNGAMLQQPLQREQFSLPKAHLSCCVSQVTSHNLQAQVEADEPFHGLLFI